MTIYQKNLIKRHFHLLKSDIYFLYLEPNLPILHTASFKRDLYITKKPTQQINQKKQTDSYTQKPC